MYIVFVQISVKLLGNKFDRIHIGDRALSRTKDNCTCLPHPLIEKQYYVLGMHSRFFAWLRDFYAQYNIEESPLSSSFAINLGL